LDQRPSRQLLKTLKGVDLLLINDTETKLLAGTKIP